MEVRIHQLYCVLPLGACFVCMCCLSTTCRQYMCWRPENDIKMFCSLLHLTIWELNLELRIGWLADHWGPKICLVWCVCMGASMHVCMYMTGYLWGMSFLLIPRGSLGSNWGLAWWQVPLPLEKWCFDNHLLL